MIFCLKEAYSVGTGADTEWHERRKNMETDKICTLLDEISLYFYGCYRNAGGGTRACEKLNDYMCAVDEAKKLICRNEGEKDAAKG